MTSKDLRFFDSPGAQILPDGYPRRGMSVVAALSEWLVHTNRRSDGSWTQRYEHGVPVTDLLPIADDDTTGTTIYFLPIAAVQARASATASALGRLAKWPSLESMIVTEETAESL